MAISKNDELDLLLKKLDEAEKEYEEKLNSTDLAQFLNKEDMLRKSGS
ncbi:MAG: hypothetical protein IKS32_11060 [Solobacterium sp.]|nr:hypothetical protein [Solobacterium sp.]